MRYTSHLQISKVRQFKAELNLFVWSVVVLVSFDIQNYPLNIRAQQNV